MIAIITFEIEGTDGWSLVVIRLTLYSDNMSSGPNDGSSISI